MSGLTCRPVCAVHDALLEQGVVDAHDDAAGHLRLAAQLVDDQAAILHGDDLRAADHAGLGVDQRPRRPARRRPGRWRCSRCPARWRWRGSSRPCPWPRPCRAGHRLPSRPSPSCWLRVDDLARLDRQVFRLGARASARSCRTGRRGPPGRARASPGPATGRWCCRRSRSSGRTGSRRSGR